MKSHPEDPLDQQVFETACGVGVVVTPEQIEDVVCQLTFSTTYSCLIAVACLSVEQDRAIVFEVDSRSELYDLEV